MNVSDFERIAEVIAGIDPRWVLWIAFGIGGLYVWGDVTRDRWRNYRRRRDRRSQRAWISSLALMFVAVFSALGIFMVLFGEEGRAPRSFLVAAAFGAYLAAGIVVRDENSEDTP